MPINFPLLTIGAAPTDGVSEVQSLTPAGPIAAGTFTVTFDGETTAALDFDATFAEIQTALDALDNVGEGNLTVGPEDPENPDELFEGGVVLLTFAGDLAGLPVAEVTVDDSLLVDDADPTPQAVTITVATETAGVRGTYRGAQPGALVQDTANGFLYQNTGTEQSPAWVDLGA